MSPTRKPKTILVTGSEGSLGREVSRRFLEDGCEVIGTWLREAPAEFVGLGGKFQGLKIDLTDPQATKKLPPVDAFIHCAGGFRWKTLEKSESADLDFLLKINLLSAYNGLRELLPGMAARGFGRVVLVGALATQKPSAGMGLYNASKAGISTFTQCFAEEVKDQDVNINAVLPSILDTPPNRKEMPTADFSKWVSLSELAEIIFNLTQPWAKAIHGALIPVSGRV